jgi:hypothetical protein
MNPTPATSTLCLQCLMPVRLLSYVALLSHCRWNSDNENSSPSTPPSPRTLARVVTSYSIDLNWFLMLTFVLSRRSLIPSNILNFTLQTISNSVIYSPASPILQDPSKIVLLYNTCVHVDSGEATRGPGGHGTPQQA